MAKLASEIALRTPLSLAILSLPLTCLYFLNSPTYNFLLALFIGLWGALALGEYFDFFSNRLTRTERLITLFASPAYILAVHCELTKPEQASWAPLVLFAAFSALTFTALSRGIERATERLALSIFGLFYIVWTLSFVVRLSFMHPSTVYDGRYWLIFVLACTISYNTGGLVFGRLLGKRKLCSILSPKKTVAGLIGGLLAAGTVAFALNQFMAPSWLTYFSISPWQAALIGVVIGAVAQLGDLVESLIKRDVGVKDSGYLPAVGGVLDTTDSYFFTVPVLYFILSLL